MSDISISEWFHTEYGPAVIIKHSDMAYGYCIGLRNIIHAMNGTHGRDPGTLVCGYRGVGVPGWVVGEVDVSRLQALVCGFLLRMLKKLDPNTELSGTEAILAHIQIYGQPEQVNHIVAIGADVAKKEVEIDKWWLNLEEFCE